MTGANSAVGLRARCRYLSIPLELGRVGGFIRSDVDGRGRCRSRSPGQRTRTLRPPPGWASSRRRPSPGPAAFTELNGLLESQQTSAATSCTVPALFAPAVAALPSSCAGTWRAAPDPQAAAYVCGSCDGADPGAAREPGCWSTADGVHWFQNRGQDGWLSPVDPTTARWAGVAAGGISPPPGERASRHRSPDRRRHPEHLQGNLPSSGETWVEEGESAPSWQRRLHPVAPRTIPSALLSRPTVACCTVGGAGVSRGSRRGRRSGPSRAWQREVLARRGTRVLMGDTARRRRVARSASLMLIAETWSARDGLDQVSRLALDTGSPRSSLSPSFVQVCGCPRLIMAVRWDSAGRSTD